MLAERAGTRRTHRIHNAEGMSGPSFMGGQAGSMRVLQMVTRRSLKCTTFLAYPSFIQQRTTMQVGASIFKAYDIRGIVGQTLSEAVAEHLGRAFGTEALKLGEKGVAGGRDE